MLSCWLKCHYPDVFAAAILNSQPMGFYSSSQLVRDAREHSVEILPVDVNLSVYDNTPGQVLHPAICIRRNQEMRHDIHGNHALRLGFARSECGGADAARLVSARGHGYATIRDLWLRSGLLRGVIERLADADAFRSMGLDRRAARWEAKALEGAVTQSAMPLFDIPQSGRLVAPDPLVEPQTRLPQLTA
ncbi:MAG: hypothetical protein R3D34_02285 [Nitratireductor sp.]